MDAMRWHSYKSVIHADLSHANLFGLISRHFGFALVDTLDSFVSQLVVARHNPVKRNSAKEPLYGCECKCVCENVWLVSRSYEISLPLFTSNLLQNHDNKMLTFNGIGSLDNNFSFRCKSKLLDYHLIFRRQRFCYFSWTHPIGSAAAIEKNVSTTSSSYWT